MHFNKGKAYERQRKAPKAVKFAEALLLSYVILFILHEARRMLFSTNLLTKWVNKQVNNNINNDNNNNNFSEKKEKKYQKKYKKTKYNSSISAAFKNVKFVFL